VTVSIVACPLLFWTKSSAVAGDSCHVYSLSPLPMSSQVHGVGYSKSEVETDMAALELESSIAALELQMNATALKLEADAAALDLETETNVPQEILKQERYSID
jgi:hypothetical protein